MKTNRVKKLFARWRTDYDFKTVTAAFGSLALTAVFALYNGFLWIYNAALWHGSICVYYIVLVLLSTIIITARKRTGGKDGQEHRKNNVIRPGKRMC